MANERPQYVIRDELPPIQGEATPEQIRAIEEQRGAYGAGAAIRRHVSDATEGVAERSFRNAVQQIPWVGPMVATAAPMVTTQPGRITMRDFFDGLAGAPKGGVKTPVKAEQPAARGAQVVDAAMQAGRKAADTPLTPQEKMLAHLDTLLSRPMTLRGMAAISGALSQTTANAPRPASAKDNVLASTAEISQMTYDTQIKDIMAKRAAGEMTLEQAQAASAKATDAYFLRNTALVGNPLSFAQANMLPAPAEEPKE